MSEEQLKNISPDLNDVMDNEIDIHTKEDKEEQEREHRSQELYERFLRKIKNEITEYHEDIEFSRNYSAPSQVTTLRFQSHNPSFSFKLDKYSYEKNGGEVKWHSLNDSHISAITGEHLFQFTQSLVVKDLYGEKERDITVFHNFCSDNKPKEGLVIDSVPEIENVKKLYEDEREINDE